MINLNKYGWNDKLNQLKEKSISKLIEEVKMRKANR